MGEFIGPNDEQEEQIEVDTIVLVEGETGEKYQNSKSPTGSTLFGHETVDVLVHE